jgi:hypothetical protein
VNSKQPQRLVPAAHTASYNQERLLGIHSLRTSDPIGANTNFRVANTTVRVSIQCDYSTPTIGDSRQSMEASRVAVRLPALWAERPAVWFAPAEAQFSLAAMSSERTKIYCTISQLDHR